MRRFSLTLMLLPVGGTVAATLLATHHDISTSAAMARGPIGPAAMLGNGTIHTFVTLDSAGHPTAVGATFTEGLLSNLPDTNAPFTLDLGPDAAITPFTHLYFDWVPMGHAPGGVYDRPHMDFHFCLASVEDRLAVAGGVDSMPLPPARLPKGYAKVTESVAFMGTHFGDTSAAEFHGREFEKTLLYGSHEGKFTFYDLMAAAAWLRTKPNLVVPIKQPAEYPAPGYFPTRYSVSYDSAAATYRVALEGFVAREPRGTL